jgi:hypothetical protein
LKYYENIAEAITQKISNAKCIANSIPKEYVAYDLYCNLIPAGPDALYFK